MNPIGHLVKDVGIPVASMTASAGAVAGAALVPSDRKTGAAIGMLIGLLVGLLIDWAQNRRNASNTSTRRLGERPSPRSSRRRMVR